jgi:hypothetical protein
MSVEDYASKPIFHISVCLRHLRRINTLKKNCNLENSVEFKQSFPGEGFVPYIASIINISLTH